MIPDLYRTAPYPCPYLPERTAANIVVDPFHPSGPEIYDLLVEQGFRRNGRILYRPHCVRCHECVPVRVPAHRFRPDRAQRRTWKRNQDLAIAHLPVQYRAEHFALYRAYQSARHGGDSMDDPDPEKYRQFVLESNVRTELVEMSVGGRPLAVAIVDRLRNGLSAVYTFFDPDLARRSLGTFAVLYQIERCRRLGLAWTYLGFWIGGCRKMSYKTGFRPIEGYDPVHGEWRPLDGDGPRP